MKQIGKKGVNTIIATVLLLFLVLIVVFILWKIMKTNIKKASEETQISIITSSLNLEIKEALLHENSITITIKRSTGKAELVAIKLIFETDSKSYSYVLNESHGLPNPLETKSYEISLDELGIPAGEEIIRVSIAPVFMFANKQKLGNIVDSKKISRAKAICGNTKCEIGETSEECPQDCNALVLENKYVRFVFDEKGNLEEIWNMQTGKNYKNEINHPELFTLYTFQNGFRAKPDWKASQDTPKIVFGRKSDHDFLSVLWDTEFDGYPALVNITYRLYRNEPFLHIRFMVKNKGEEKIVRIGFPRIFDLQPQLSNAYIPIQEGIRLKLSTLKPDCEFCENNMLYYHYPVPMSMQIIVLEHVDGNEGLYLYTTNNGTGTSKFFVLANSSADQEGDGGNILIVEHETNIGQGEEWQAEEIILGVFTGNYLSALQQYKSWASKYFRQREKLGVEYAYRIWGKTHPDYGIERNPNEILEVDEEMQNLVADKKRLVYFTGIGKDGYDIGYPWDFEPYNESLPEKLRELQAKEDVELTIHWNVLVYDNKSFYDEPGKSWEEWKNHTFMYYAGAGLSYNIENWQVSDREKRAMYAMSFCPDSAWPENMSQVIDEIYAEYDVENIFLDTMGTKLTSMGYDYKHGCYNFQAIVEWIKNIREKYPNLRFCTEAPNEQFLAYYDCFWTWQLNTISWNYSGVRREYFCKDNDVECEIVKMFSYVYPQATYINRQLKGKTCRTQDWEMPTEEIANKALAEDVELVLQSSYVPMIYLCEQHMPSHFTDFEICQFKRAIGLTESCEQ